MKTTFDFVMSEKDYVSCILHNFVRKSGLAVVFGSLLVFLAIFISGERDPLAYLPPLIAGVVVSFILFASMYGRARKIYRDTPTMQQRRSVQFDSNGFEMTQQSGDFRSSWSDINIWQSNQREMTIWLNQAMMILIPRNQETASSIDTMAEYLQNSGLGKGKKRKRR